MMTDLMAEERTEALDHFPPGSSEYLESYPPDVLLTVKDREFQCHGAFLSLHSRFFAKLLSDCKSNSASMIDGKVVIKLEDSAEDVELMLSLLYGSRLWLTDVSAEMHSCFRQHRFN